MANNVAKLTLEMPPSTKRKENGVTGGCFSVRRGTRPLLIWNHTMEVLGIGSDDVGFIQSTKAPEGKRAGILRCLSTFLKDMAIHATGSSLRTGP
jgi:hypothetical protein